MGTERPARPVPAPAENLGITQDAKLHPHAPGYCCGAYCRDLSVLCGVGSWSGMVGRTRALSGGMFGAAVFSKRSGRRPRRIWLTSRSQTASKYDASRGAGVQADFNKTVMSLWNAPGFPKRAAYVTHTIIEDCQAGQEQCSGLGSAEEYPNQTIFASASLPPGSESGSERR